MLNRECGNLYLLCNEMLIMLIDCFVLQLICRHHLVSAQTEEFDIVFAVVEDVFTWWAVVAHGVIV